MRGLSRREVLKIGATMAGGVLTGSGSQAIAAQKKPAGYIDAHSHIWTRDVTKFPLAAGKTVADLDPPSFTISELMDVARPQGVDRVVLIAHNIYYGFDNRYLVHAANLYPETFRVVGMVDDTKPHPDVEMKRLHTQHVTGFRITPFRSGPQWLENPGMKLMWKCAAETGQAMCCLIDPDDLPQVDRMCADFPDTRVVIDHFARIGADGEIHESELKNLRRLARFKNTFVKISAYYALGKKQEPYHDLIPMIRSLYEAFGAERLMWASDSPYQIVGDHTYKASIALVREQLDFVSPEERDWLLRKTAERVYF